MATDTSHRADSSIDDDASMPPGVVPVVDDEAGVHKVTELLLGDTYYRGGSIEILGATSAAILPGGR